MAILDFKDFSCKRYDYGVSMITCSKGWLSWLIRDPEEYILKTHGVVEDFITSNIANFLIPGRAPEVSLVKDYESDIVYSASKRLPTFSPGDPECGQIVGEMETGIVSQLLLHCNQHEGNLGYITTPEGIQYSAIVNFDASSSDCGRYRNNIIGAHVRTLVIPRSNREVQDESEKIINFINNKKEEITSLFKDFDNDLEEVGLKSSFERMFWSRVQLLSNELNIDRALTALFNSSDVTSSVFKEKYLNNSEPCRVLDYATEIPLIKSMGVFGSYGVRIMPEEKFEFIASYFGRCTETSDYYARSTEYDNFDKFDTTVIVSFIRYSDADDIGEYSHNFRKILPYIHDKPSVIKHIEEYDSKGNYGKLLQINTEYEIELRAQLHSNLECEQNAQVIGDSHHILD